MKLQEKIIESKNYNSIIKKECIPQGYNLLECYEFKRGSVTIFLKTYREPYIYFVDLEKK